MASIKQLCPHSVLLEKGTVKMTGDTEDVVRYYMHDSQMIQKESVLERTNRSGNRKALLEAILFADKDGNIVDHVVSGEPCSILVQVRNKSLTEQDKLDQLTIAMNNAYGERVLVLSNQFVGKEVKLDTNKETTTIAFNLNRCPLNAGEYSMAFYMNDSFGAVIDWIDNLPPIIVWAGDFYNSGNVVREGLGMFLTDFDVKNA